MRWAARLALLALALLALGVVGHRAVQSRLQARLASDLQTLLRAEVTALDLWIEDQINVITVVADYDRITRRMHRLAVESAELRTPEDLLNSPLLAEFRAYVRPMSEAFGYLDGVLITPDGRTVASLRNEAIGKTDIPQRTDAVQQALQGTPALSRPFRSEIPIPNLDGKPTADEPILMGFAPIRSPDGEIVAVAGFRMHAEAEFSRILTVARPGLTGETYAFDARGLMLSDSRFDDELRTLGLLPEDSAVSSVLHVEVRNPGVNLTAGETTDTPRNAQPLTTMAASAVSGLNGVNVTGYRDYRGVEVIGAWTWIEQHGFGVATEVDKAEGYHGLTFLTRVFWVLFGLVAIFAVGGFVSTLVIDRLRRRVHEAMSVGQYTLETKIGEGGMGKVYRARHALLRRPTAVKILPEVNAKSVARFEREVQLTAGLTHPNTVAIYDYGRTNGVFYYAMEYLPGLNLSEVVRRFGPLPEARVIHFLRQVCGSLAEAHSVGLIHRDIKPGNLLLCERGGRYDVVKVLDFGLVKDVSAPESTELTAKHSVTGTPNYVSPESINNQEAVDGRSDLYSLGVVAFFLLTGQQLFEGSAMEVLMSHLKTKPRTPSEVAGRPIAPDLEAVIMHCLAKRQDDRPASAGELARDLEACKDARGWNQQLAEAWWLEHDLPEDPSLTEGQDPSATASERPTLDIDLQARVR